MAAATHVRSAAWLVSFVQQMRAAVRSSADADPPPKEGTRSGEKKEAEPRSLERAAVACASRGVPLLLVPEILHGESDSACSRDPATCKHGYYRTFEEIAVRSGGDVHYCSVLPAFPRSTRDRVMVDESHMNPQGYRLLAASIAECMAGADLAKVGTSLAGSGQPADASPRP